MATSTTRWGNAPLTAEGLANLGHPLSLSDFNQDAGGYWRMIRGEKTYYPREWFDQAGTFTGTGTQPGDRAGQDSGFFKQGMKWNWQTGQWENPTNWANVIGVAAAGGVGAGIAAPAIGAALGGGGATTAGGGVGISGVGGGVPTLAIDAGATTAGTGGGVASSLIGGSTIGDLIKGGTSIYGTIRQAGSAKDATEAQAAATKYAADLQAKANADQLAYLKQQAGYDATVAEANRAGNYEQWAAKQELLGPVGQALGLPARRIPAYVPLPTNVYGTGAPAPTGTGTPPPSGGTAPPPTSTGALGVSAANGDIASQVAAYYKARGVTPNPTSVGYWASKWNEFGAKDPEYFNRRLSQADEFGGGGVAAPAAAAPRVQPLSTDPLGSVAGYLVDPADTSYGRLAPLPVMRPYYAGPVAGYLA